jgi:hypothetical protein
VMERGAAVMVDELDINASYSAATLPTVRWSGAATRGSPRVQYIS